MASRLCVAIAFRCVKSAWSSGSRKWRVTLRRSGRPMTVSLLQKDHKPEQWRYLLDQIRLANQEGPTVYKGHFEIVSLVVTLSTNGSHLHLAVSDSTGRTVGGHLLDGYKVYTTAKIVIGESADLIFTREKDGASLWKELKVLKVKS